MWTHLQKRMWRYLRTEGTASLCVSIQLCDDNWRNINFLLESTSLHTQNLTLTGLAKLTHKTSNVTDHHWTPKCKCTFVCRCAAPLGECYYNTLFCCTDFSSSSVVLRAFSALCMYSKFGHHHHPLGYLCAIFHFFRGLYYWDSIGEKSHT